MKTTTKYLIGAGLLLAGVSSYFGKQKLNAANEVLSNLQIKIKAISNFRFTLQNLSFKLRLEILNPTNIDFGATLTSKISIKTVRIFSPEGNFLAVANPNISNIDLPSNTSSELTVENVNLDINNALNELGNNITSYLQSDYTRLKYKIDIAAFGKIITLDA
jgi:hypothetical protein